MNEVPIGSTVLYVLPPPPREEGQTDEERQVVLDECVENFRGLVEAADAGIVEIDAHPVHHPTEGPCLWVTRVF